MHFEASAELSCKDLFKNQNGPQFLKQQEPNLHTTSFIERMAQKIKRRFGVQLQKPTDRISAWIKYLESMYVHIQKHPRSAQKIKKIFHNQYVIKPKNVPQSYFDLQTRIAREQGHGNVALTPEIRQKYIETIIADQKRSLDLWLDYFMSKDSEMYPMWTKHWMLTGMTKLSTFDPETFTFAKRSDDTAAPFAELNREAIAYVVDMIVKKANGDSLKDIESPELRSLLDGANFGKLYGIAIKRAMAQQSPLTITDGVWVKYPQGSNHRPLVKSLEGKGTNWCTAGASTARSQLDGGDFHVYYSRDKAGDPTMPRIAIRMNGDQQIAEVRGIAKQQNLDPNIANTNILTNKLNEFGDQGRIYQTRSAHMKKLTLIENKNKKGEELTVDELKFLYEMNEKIQGFGYEKDPRIAEIIATRNLKQDLAFVFNCKPEQISTTKEEALSGNFLVHYGDLYLPHLTSAEGLILPQHITGSLSLYNLTSVEVLKLPQYIGGDLRLDKLTKIDTLILPEDIKGSLVLSSLTSAVDLTFPLRIGGSLNLERLKTAEGVKLPQNIGGSLELSGITSVQGITLPSYIGESLYLRSITTAQGITLPSYIGESLYLSGLTSAKGLILPQHIGGTLSFFRLISAKGLKLPKDFPLARINASENVLNELRSR